MSFMKMRALPPRPSFGEQGKKATQRFGGGGGRRGPIQGEYNSFWPREDKALWWAICPTQSWSFEMYDREEREVKKYEGQYFYGYTHHYVAATKRKFVCSATAHRSKPCWGCGIRDGFYSRLREEEAVTGVRRKGESPIGAMQQFALAGVLLEKVTKIPVLDKNGVARKTKAGQPIVRDTPLSSLSLADQKKYKDQGNVQFGLSTHYSVGSTTLNELLGFDSWLQNFCANCGNGLHVAHAECPECLTSFQIVEDADLPISGQDLAEARLVEYNCDCGYAGPLYPVVQCACESPEQGSLAAFAIRIKTETVAEKKKVLKLTEFKPLQQFVTANPAVEDLLMNPLEIDKIFGPTDLNFQASMIPENYRGDGVSPNPKTSEPVAKGYEFTPTTDSDE